MTVRIGAVELGTGRPRICVPLTGTTVDALAAEAAAVRPEVADLVELRIDRFEEIGSSRAVERAVDAVRAGLDPGLPILFTCRSVREGGGAALPPALLEAVSSVAAGHGAIAAVDVEMEATGGLARTLAARVHEHDKVVVMSFHDFTSTPPHDEIVDRLARQAELGADVVKLACTPRTAADVLRLLGATAAYAARPGARPAITMAMGPLGAVSRIAGETFGSVVTFGTVGAASAPGQLDAGRLRDALDLLHEARQQAS